ncbi:MAG: hypothetical protein WC479_12520 [Candidatus Izemoplasmatales bacterium]|jgi:hypothetical protein
MDGEGSIGINKIINYNGTKTTYYRLLVQVCMIDGFIPQWLCDSFGGSILARKGKPPRRNITQWQIANKQASAFLQTVLPYLRIKKPQAEIAIEFQSKRLQTCGGIGKRGRPYKTDGEQAIEESQFIMMQNLKKQEGTYV